MIVEFNEHSSMVAELQQKLQQPIPDIIGTSLWLLSTCINETENGEKIVIIKDGKPIKSISGFRLSQPNSDSDGKTD